MIRLVKYFFVFTMLGSAVCSLEANETVGPHPIVEIARNLVFSYDKKFSEGDFKEAYSSAKELLDIFPSDAASYLRLAIAARELNLNLSEIKSMYGACIAESTDEEKALKLLANALLVAPN